MNKLSVTCAIIRRNGKVFATRRPEGKSLAGYWEFPGGKLEENESLFECITREIKEELAMQVIPQMALPQVFYDYGAFHIDLHPILCDIVNEKYELREHADAGWFGLDDLKQLNWAPADLPIVEQLILGNI